MIKGTIEHLTWNGRELTIYLPPSYKNTRSKKYPAVLVQDGGYLFLESLGEIEQDLNNYKTEEVLFIGITSFNRDKEYTPWKMANDRDGNFGEGGASDYIAMLTGELLPFLRKQYRISTDHLEIGMAGASFGGLVSLYSLLVASESFGRYCLLSPSLWYEHMMEFIEQHEDIEYGAKIFMYIGEKEGKRHSNALRNMVPNNKIAYQLLKNKLTHEAAGIEMMIEPNGEHLHAYFTEYFPKGIRFLYPKVDDDKEKIRSNGNK